MLRAGEADLYVPYWSDDILEEMRRNLIDHERVTIQQAQRLVEVIVAYFPDSRVIGYTGLVDEMRNHPKDRHVLAAAVKCGAQLIVTSNLRHFPDDALVRYGIEARSPDEFLPHLLDINQERMLKILEQQAGDLRDPQRTYEQVLDEIALHAPGFIAAVREVHERAAKRG